MRRTNMGATNILMQHSSSRLKSHFLPLNTIIFGLITLISFVISQTKPEGKYHLVKFFSFNYRHPIEGLEKSASTKTEAPILMLPALWSKYSCQVVLLQGEYRYSWIFNLNKKLGLYLISKISQNRGLYWRIIHIMNHWMKF